MMVRLLTHFFVVVLVLCGAFASVPARADYVSWQDDKTGVSFSYPDTWTTVNNQQPNDIVTLALPSGEDQATCRVRADDEHRFLMYPSEYQGDIQKVNYAGQEFWTNYLSLYEQPTIHSINDGAGLGRSFASIATVSYLNAPDEPYAFKKSVLAVSPYYQRAYMVECSAMSGNYNAYHDMFLSFMKSVNFKKEFHELTVGEYPRNFLSPRSTIEVPLQNGVSTTTY